MIEIKILGTGCVRCETLYQSAVMAASRVEQFGQTVTVEKVKDRAEFFRLKVHMTPGLVINDHVISMGTLLSPEEIEAEIIKFRAGL